MATDLNTPITLTIRELLQYTRTIEKDVRESVELEGIVAGRTTETGAEIYDRGFNAGIDHAATQVLDNLEPLRNLYEQDGVTAVRRVILHQAAESKR